MQPKSRPSHLGRVVVVVVVLLGGRVELEPHRIDTNQLIRPRPLRGTGRPRGGLSERGGWEGEQRKERRCRHRKGEMAARQDNRTRQKGGGLVAGQVDRKRDAHKGQASDQATNGKCIGYEKEEANLSR